MGFADLTGRGVRVGIVDSGVNPAHPHVGPIAGGVCIGPLGQSAIYLDRLGHGTAVAGAIREKARDSLIFAVKVFERELLTSSAAILEAIEWCLAQDIHVINLSVGVRSANGRARFEELAARAAAANVALVVPQDACVQDALPGCFPGAIAVGADFDCPRDEFRCAGAGSRTCFHASGYPRPIPGVPPQRNLHGVSFAVANMTGFVTRAREAHPSVSLDELQRILVEHSAAAGARAPEAIALAAGKRDHGQV